MSALSNPLLENGLSQFDGTVNLDALAGVMDPGFSDQDGDGVPDHWNQELAPLHTNHRGYIGDDGSLYRKEVSISPEGEVTREYTDERLYFWTPPQELGRAPNDPASQEQAMAGPEGFGAAGLYTEAEIKEAWEADEGMGYLKEHTDWDSYWNFVQKTTDLFTDPTYNDMTDGNMTVGNFQDSPEYMALLEETGIPTQYVNDDGDVFNFNGTTYVKDYKTDDDIGVDVINSAFLGVIGSVVAGPLIAGALTGAGMGAAAAKAASSAIMSLTQDALTTGDLSFKDALLSAGTAYLGESFTGSFEDSLVDAVDKSEQIRDGLLGKFAEAGVDPNSAAGAELFDNLMNQYETLDTAKQVGGTVSDIVSSVWDAYKESPDYDVDYGGADPENTDIINNGTQNENDEFEEDFGVDTDIDMPTITPIDEDVDGGGGGGGDTGGDAGGDATSGDVTGGDTGGDVVSETQGQYEVIGRNPDGTVIVRDNIDGDVWILEGDWEEGDFVDEEQMVDATRGDGDIDSGTVDDTVTDDDDLITNSQIDILIDRGMTQEQAEANQESAINQGADANGDGMVTDEEWAEHTGGDGDSTTIGDDNTSTDTGGDITGGDGGDSTTPGGDGVDGDGVDGVGIDGDGTGGEGDGDGDGDGNGDGDGVGLLAGGGGDYTPEWGELFQYTTITPYQAKQLEPVRPYIAKARGMLS